MANNPYAGSALYLAWVYSGGTIALHTNFRNFTWATDLNYIDATAGADTYETLLASYGTGQDFTATSVGQVDGSAILNACARATKGSVLYGPEGTATGKIKYTIPATAKGPSFNQVYNDINEITLAWRQTSVETKGTF
jgi:hypothetical protein